MGCGDEKLSKYLTQPFTAHCNAMICQQVTLLGDAEWPKVADAVIEARLSLWPGRFQEILGVANGLANYWDGICQRDGRQSNADEHADHRSADYALA